MPGLEGTTLGQYHLLRRLGKGGMSEVYLAYDQHKRRQVAVKVVSAVHTEYLERFHREAQAILRLSHRHILPAYEFGEQEPWCYLVMYYAQYGTLSRHLSTLMGPTRVRRSGRGYGRQGGGYLTLEEVALLLEQIADALQYAHDAGIIHRDIKPSNILLRNPHYAYLADFGLAKVLEGAQGLTQTGSLLGTPEYMAPELAEGPASTGSDIYALGILLYQMVTGYVPFSAETPIATFWKQLRERPVPPSRSNPAIPRSVDLVILHALEKEPQRRFRSPLALAHAYRRALQPPPSPRRGGRTGAAQLPEFDLTEFEAEIPIPDLPPLISNMEPYRDELARPTLARDPLEPAGTGDEDYMAYPVTTSTPVPVEGHMEYQAPVTEVPEAGLLAGTNLAEAHPFQPAIPARRSRSRRGVSRRRRKRYNSVVIAAAVGVGFLLLVSILMSFVYVTTVSRQEAAATATVGALTTATASSARVTATVQVQATATMSVLTSATSAAPALTDSLLGNTAGRWPENDNCQFLTGTYHVLNHQPGSLQTCVSPSPQLTLANAVIQVNVSLLSGDDAGLVFRASGQQFYDFGITGQGAFYVRRHDAGGAGYTSLIPSTASSAVVSGGTNTLTVIANGSDFKFYINAMFVGESHDATYTGGQVGFAAGTLPTDSSAEGSFSNLKIYNI